MANAARVHAVENGEDLSDYTMVAFGGAAPLHAGRLCEKLGIARCLIPPGAGVGSAIGFLRAPFSFEANRTLFMKMSQFDTERVRQLFAEMEDEATRVVRSCGWEGEILIEHKMFMRYSGQGWEIPVELTHEEARAAAPATILRRFEERYVNLFARTVAGLEAEVTVWSVNAYTPSKPIVPVEAVGETRDAAPEAGRMLFDAGLGRSLEAGACRRSDLYAGSRVNGPAVITEDETTIVLPSSRTATMLNDGCIDIRSQRVAPARQVADRKELFHA